MATAGPDLESLIAGKGSGAEELSRRFRTRIANIDIGGGTSNIALFDKGVCIGTACVNVGGRLFEVDALTHRLSYVTAPAQTIADNLAKKSGQALFPAATAEAELAGINDCLDWMVQSVERVLFRQSLTTTDQALLMSDRLPPEPPTESFFPAGWPAISTNRASNPGGFMET